MSIWVEFVIDVLALALIVAGIALVYLPAALIVCGIGVFWLGIGVSVRLKGGSARRYLAREVDE